MKRVVVDSCVVITFGNADALDLVTGLQRHSVGVCPRVVEVLLETLDVGPGIIETLARSSKTFGDLLN